MVLLTLDRGNSTLDAMLHDGARAVRRERLPPGDPAALARFLANARPVAIVALTTVPGGLDGLGPIAPRLLVAGHDLACPLPTRYSVPATLGVDRWVGALAAHERWGAALTIDCGTALTVNAVAEDGTFLGGVIAPGARALAAGLAAKAPALPAADPRRTSAWSLPATSSQDAVDAGVVLGFVGLVERLVSEVARAAGLDGAPRLLTGGEAGLVTKHATLRFEHVPDLVHQGLRCLWLRSGSPS